MKAQSKVLTALRQGYFTTTIAEWRKLGKLFSFWHLHEACKEFALNYLRSFPFFSSSDLDYEVYKEDFPYRVYEYQKIPPLISHIPVKTKRSHLGAGGKGPHTGLKSSSNSMAGRTKLRAEELHSIKGELSQIKAQVDSLLDSLDRMDQRREHPTGSKDGKKKNLSGGESSYAAGDTSRKKESAANDGHSATQEVDSADESTDTEEAVRG
ncbi:UNVERIFIED_CONTAM: hypothetical protein K2H54_037305 [Gekko kuhli]